MAGTFKILGLLKSSKKAGISRKRIYQRCAMRATGWRSGSGKGLSSVFTMGLDFILKVMGNH